MFEVDLGIAETFSGQNSEIYDCIVCCNPNKIDYEVYDGEVRTLTVSDGNESASCVLFFGNALALGS